jgi:hypothetical protein
MKERALSYYFVEVRNVGRQDVEIQTVDTKMSTSLYVHTAYVIYIPKLNLVPIIRLFNSYASVFQEKKTYSFSKRTGVVTHDRRVGVFNYASVFKTH